MYAAIKEAEANIVSPGKASQNAINTYRTIIDAAWAVYNNADASKEEIENATLDPQGNATRAESATILQRFIKGNK